MAHPWGVQPCMGTEEEEAARARSLGRLARLPDEVVLNIVSSLTDAKDLGRLGCVSRYLAAFSNHDDLWRGQVLETDACERPGWRYEGSWQESHLVHSMPGYMPGSKRPRPLRGVASDLLYQPLFYASVRIDPSWLEVDNVDRRKASEMSVEQFREQYDAPNRPVILTDVVTAWPAFKKWDRQFLLRAFEGKTVIVGDAPMPFDAYCAYADANNDELPLYLFDKKFCATAPELAADYASPPVFGEDLFTLLGDKRPDWRWLIIGPIKSGSGFHKDPNSTNAWNGCLKGRKKWVCYPPHVVPPGVRPSEDGANVATTLSLLEWFMNYYDCRDACGYTPVEFVQEEGELVFVPRGWWHIVLNLDEAWAITQNFVSHAAAPHALAFLQRGVTNPDLISGCKEEDRTLLYDRFVEALERERPQVLAAVRQEQEQRRRKAEEHHKLASLFAKPGEAVANGEAATNGAAVNGSAAAGKPASCAVEAAAATAAGPSAGGGFSFSFFN